jgi:hypothetical protein
MTEEEKADSEYIKMFESNVVYVTKGVDDVDPARVDEIEAALFK